MSKRIPLEGKSNEELATAIMEYADCYNDLDEVLELLNSEWVTICEDGIIVWVDGE